MNAIRKLSAVEASFAYMHALLRGNTQVTTLLSVNALFGSDVLTRSVACWVHRLPVLAVRIREDWGGLWFCEGPGPTADQLRLSRLPFGQSPTGMIARELNDILPTGGPLWRLHAVADPDAEATHFYFTRNHAISDGYSTAGLLRALLDILFGAVGAEGGGAAGAELRSLPRNSDQLTYRPPHPETPLSGCPPIKQIPFYEIRPWGERRTEFVTVDLPAEESAVVKRFCKAHGLTVNEFFVTTLAESFAETVSRDAVGFFTAVSLRKRYAEAEFLPDPGCFISVVKAPLHLDGGSLVANAHNYRSRFGAADAAWRPSAWEHAQIRRAVENVAGLDAFPGICITNVGAVDTALGPHSDRVTGFRTVVNRIGANYGMVLHLSTFRGSFGLTLSYGSPSMDRAVVAGTAKLLRERAGVIDLPDPVPSPAY